MPFDNHLGYILSIPMCVQNFIKIFHSVQEIRPFSLFQNLALGKASTDDKCHFAIVSLFSEFERRQKLTFDDKCQNIPNGLRVNGFTFYRIWTSAKPRPIPNAIWQSPGLHLVNINVYAKFHHNIPLSSRDKAIITFSEFGAPQSLDQWKMSFRNLLG